MSATFYPISLLDPVIDCTICFDPLQDNVVAHADKDADSDETLHCFHTACIRRWAKERPTCPLCRKYISLSSLFSFKERAIQWIKDLSAYSYVFIIAGLSAILSVGITMSEIGNNNILGAGVAIVSGTIIGVIARVFGSLFLQTEGERNNATLITAAIAARFVYSFWWI